MTPLADRFLLLLPAFVMLALVLLSAAPVTLFNLSLTPNIAWLATIAFTRVVPQAMPALLVFAVGLLQDVVFGTPLGSQATLALLLLFAVRARPTRVGVPLLRDMWLEGAVLLALAQLALCLVLAWVRGTSLPVFTSMGALLINILWFPLMAWVAVRFTLLLPK